jgi:hypothetical protein
MSPQAQWVSYPAGDHAHLPDKIRNEPLQRAEAERKRRGKLLAVVEVRVYELAEAAQVNVQPGAPIGSENDSLDLTEIVARARGELDRFQMDRPAAS